MTRKMLRIDTGKCPWPSCEKEYCESIIPGLYKDQPIMVNDWSLWKWGRNYQRIRHAIELCPHNAIYLEDL